MTLLLWESKAVAVKLFLPSTFRMTAGGSMAIRATAPALTVTVAVPLSPATSAWMVAANTPVLVPAVKSPALSMLPPPLTTLQVKVTVTSLPWVSKALAANCWVPPAATSVVAGVISILARAPLWTTTEA